MSRRERVASPPGEIGFSMVEFLIAAFIMAIGILGLTMLMTMTIRSSAGSSSMTTAVKVGTAVAEQIEAEGRLLLLYARNGQTLPATTSFFENDTKILVYYDAKGNKLSAAANSFFNVSITRSQIVTAVAPVGGVKGFQILVEFSEAPNPNNPGAFIKRSVTFNRQVAYAKA